MKSLWLTPPEWLAVLRIGLGLWWLESVRHKNIKAWLQRGVGIEWGASVAREHKFGFVRKIFDGVVAPHPLLFSWIVILGEGAVGLGLTLGFLTPVAAIGGLLLNIQYFILMIKDWAEQGQNLMMALISVVVLGAEAWQCWSLDHAIGLFS